MNPACYGLRQLFVAGSCRIRVHRVQQLPFSGPGTPNVVPESGAFRNRLGYAVRKARRTRRIPIIQRQVLGQLH